MSTIRETAEKMAHDALKRTLHEEATVIERLVKDPDSACPARTLRRE